MGSSEVKQRCELNSEHHFDDRRILEFDPEGGSGHIQFTYRIRLDGDPQVTNRGAESGIIQNQLIVGRRWHKYGTESPLLFAPRGRRRNLLDASRIWWARPDSNREPRDYESPAL